MTAKTKNAQNPEDKPAKKRLKLKFLI